MGREPYSCFSCEGQECVLTTSALRVNWPRRDGAAGKAHPPHRVVTGVAVQARLPRDAEDVAVASHSPLVETEARGGDAACDTLDTSAMHGRVARWSVEHGEDAEGRLFAYVTELVFCGRLVEIAAHRCADAWYMGVEHRSAHTRADRAIALM